MNPQTAQSYSWLRKIPGDLFALDEKPLLGFPPPFPWDKFSDEIARSLQTKDLSISPGELQWRTKEDLFAGLGGQLNQVSLSIGPLAGNVWWVMPEHSVIRFMELLLLKDQGDSAPSCKDPDFIKACCQFLSIEAIAAFQKMEFDKKLAPVVTQATELPAESCLCQDVTIAFKNETFYGRLCLSSSFRKAWTQRYLQQLAALTTLPIADSLDVIVHIVAGKIDIKPSEWRQLAIGDFVLIDSCSLDPDDEKGRVMLVINNTPCFRARVKPGSLKILEHPLYYEVDKFMATLPPKDKSPADDDFDDSDFEDIDHPTEPAASTDAAAKGAAVPSHPKDTGETHAKGEDFDFDDSDFDDENDIEKTAAPEKAAATAPAASPPVPGAAVKSASPEAPKTAPNVPSSQATPVQAPAQTPLSVEDIPLSVVIEVGRIQMSVKKLLELQPGNMLELDIHPESSVDMVVNGKRIARGELLRIGDVLGIRIMELS